MATNLWQNTSWVTNEFLDNLLNELQFITGCNTDYGNRFTMDMKIGESVKVRKPQVYAVRTGETFSGQAVNDQFSTITVQDTVGVDVEIPNRELMFNKTSLIEQVIQPAAATLANDIEQKAIELATKRVANVVGTPGTTPSSLETYNTARAIMFEAGAPKAGQDRLIINAAMGVKTQTAGTAWFNPSQRLSDAFEQGYIGQHFRARVYESQVLDTLTTGGYDGTPLVNGASQSGSTIATDGWTASQTGVVKEGDVMSFASTNAVNRWTKKSTGRVAYAVVTADTDSDGSGEATIPIQMYDGNGMTVTGINQNVTGSPADNAAISLYGTAAGTGINDTESPQGLRYNRNAFAFNSFAQPEAEGGVVQDSASDPKSTITIRFLKQFEIRENRQLYRFDVVWAFGHLWNQMACRIAG